MLLFFLFRWPGDFIVIPSTRTVMDVYSAFVNWGWKKVPQMEVKIAQDGYECKLKVKGQEVMYGYGNGPTKKSAKERAGEIFFIIYYSVFTVGCNVL